MSTPELNTATATTVQYRRVRTSIGQPLLELRGVSVRFGRLVALDDVTFDVRRGEILGLVGPDGAGKTLVFDVISGMYRPMKGKIVLDGRAVGRQRSGHRGVARTYQNMRPLHEMSVVDHVLLATHARHHLVPPGMLLRSAGQRREDRQDRVRAMELTELVGLGERAQERARTLSFAERRRLEIACALAGEPILLCLDEPTAGLRAAEKDAMLALIGDIRAAGHTVVLLEHDRAVVAPVADRVMSLEAGRIILDDVTMDAAPTPPPANVTATPVSTARTLGQGPAEVVPLVSGAFPTDVVAPEEGGAIHCSAQRESRRGVA